MQSSYQFHYGGQAAAAKGAAAATSSPTKSPGLKATGAAAPQSSSSMFVAKVDWGAGNAPATGGASGQAANSNAKAVPFGFGGPSGGASFGGGGASFGGPGAAASSFGGPGSSFGGPGAASNVATKPGFGS